MNQQPIIDEPVYQPTHDSQCFATCYESLDFESEKTGEGTEPRNERPRTHLVQVVVNTRDRRISYRENPDTFIIVQREKEERKA